MAWTHLGSVARALKSNIPIYRPSSLLVEKQCSGERVWEEGLESKGLGSSSGPVRWHAVCPSSGPCPL